MSDDATAHERLVRQIFDACIDLSAEDRRRLLEGTDPAVRAEVELLLRADTEGEERLRRLDDPDMPGTVTGVEGELVGRYEVFEELGRGGMGVVHRARDTVLGRQLVLKFLTPAGPGDDEARGRFAIEAKAASALDHPNICTVYDVGTTSTGRMYIAMAYYEGQTLKSRISKGPLATSDALEIAVQVLSGLGRAHDAGIVHRDVKPANVMLTSRGEVKLLDFGLAKTADPGLTRTGVVMGTLAYMAPEQILGKMVDARADLWATGVMLYEMLAGQRPFRGDYDQAILYSIAHEEPPRLEELAPDVPAAVCDVVRGLMQKDPAQRPQSAHEVAARLSEWAAPSVTTSVPVPVGRRRFLAAVGGMAVVASVAAVLFVWFDGGRSSIGELMAEGAYLRSLEGPQNVHMAIDRFREVIRLDSSYVAGHAKLAEAYILLGNDEGEFLARQQVHRALSLDSSAAEAHVSRGLVLELYDRAWAQAEDAFLTAISLDSSNADAHYELGWLQLRTGRLEEGLASMRRARSLDPTSILTLYGIGVAEYYAGRYDAAAGTFRQVVQSAPGHAYAFAFLLMAYLQGERSIDAAELVGRIPNRNDFYRSPLGAYYFAVSGARQSAMDAVLALGADMSAWDRARVLAELGEFDRSIEVLQSIAEDPPREMNELGIEPAFRPMHGDPRFRAMLRSVGLLPDADGAP